MELVYMQFLFLSVLLIFQVVHLIGMTVGGLMLPDELSSSGKK